MADESPDTAVDQPVGPPRWVKVTGIVVAAMLVLFVVLHLIIGGGSQHGPGRHSVGHVPVATDADHGAPQ